MADNPDAALVGQSLTGDKDAYGLLVRRYQNCAFAAALGVLGDLDLAGDVVQEAFLQAWLGLAKLREPERFAGWLRGIVRHMALRALRELGRVQLLAATLPQEPITTNSERPEEPVERAEQRQRLQQALARLSASNREILWLHYMDGLPYARIAALVGISETAVQGRLQRGRGELRKELEMMESAFQSGRLPDDFAGEVRRLLEQAGQSGRPQRRIAQDLARLGPPAVEPLCMALENVRVPVRQAAARALCTIGDVRALRPLLRVLYAPDRWRVGAIFEDGSILGIPGTRKSLLEVARSGGPGRNTALYALAHAKGDAEVYEAALAIFRDPAAEASAARAAMDVLCSVRPETAVEVVAEGLRHRLVRLRGWAARLAMDRKILPPLEACLQALGGGVDMYDWLNAGRLVLRHGQAGRQVLQRLMQTGSDAERDSAGLALAQVGDAEALALLRRQLREGGLHRKWAKFITWVLRDIDRGQ